MSALNLPKAPAGHFWRVGPWFPSSGVIDVQLRRKRWFGSTEVMATTTAFRADPTSPEAVAKTARYILRWVEADTAAAKAANLLSGDYTGGAA